MPSQKSSVAVLPQRARGRARVEALLDAANEVFTERGYDQATMTEIAARADTAIGSLYRFFPTKEALGETLLRRFSEKVSAQMAELAARTVGLSPAGLADALVELMASRDQMRAATLAIVDGRGDGDEIRRAFRAEFRGQLAALLRRANPRLTASAAADRAATLLYLIKGPQVLAREEPRAAKRLTDEIRRCARLYVEAVCAERV